MPLPPEQVDHVIQLVAGYIRRQHRIYRPQGKSLSTSELESMRGFFSDALLEDTRFVVLDPAAKTRVANPDFYPLLRGMGITNLVDFSRMAVITFADVVVSHEGFDPRVLFHELVHVEQYRQLGIERFADLYVRGFLSGGGYEGIPLEIQAYSLDGRFHHAPAKRFSVATEVAHAIREGRL